MMPPASLQSTVYWARPAFSRETSLATTRWTSVRAPDPVMRISPIWERSKMPAAWSDREMLIADRGVLQRHRPAAEVGHPRVQA